MSTRQFDNTAERLPQLRASAQKYRQYTGPESDYAINTSALGRAFPDFTQSGTPSDDGDISIEVGRGAKKSNGTISRPGLSREFSSNAAINPDEDSFNFSAPMIENYEVMSTPPALPQPATKKNRESGRNSLRRDASIRRASNTQKETTQHSRPLAKTTDYVSGGSRQGSAEPRRTLAEVQAGVTDADASRLSQDRPPTVTLTGKNTRFGTAKNRQPTASDTLPERFSSAKDFMQSMSQAKGGNQQHAASQANGTITSTYNGATQQSFMLPDMPNHSELLSGLYQDGTPVFSLHGTRKGSRFASGSRGHRNQSNAQLDYAAVGEISVPADEQAIFLSLRLLQGRVAELETNRAEAEKTIQELQQKNWALEAEKSDRGRRERRDSALGMTDGGSDGCDHGSRSQRKWIIEKSRLEAAMRGLQDRADAADRKVSVAEITVRNITQDRDSAISQLGVAYYTTEALKKENAALKEENDELKSQIFRLTANNGKKQWRPINNSIEVRKRADRERDEAQTTNDITTDSFGGNYLGEQGQKSSDEHRNGNGKATAAVEERERSLFGTTRSDDHGQVHTSSAPKSIFDHMVGKTRQSSKIDGRGISADFAGGQVLTSLTNQQAQQSEEQRRQGTQALLDDLSSDDGDSENSAYDATTGRHDSIQVVQPTASCRPRDAKDIQASAQDSTTGRHDLIKAIQPNASRGPRDAKDVHISAQDATTGRHDSIQVVQPTASRGPRDAKDVQAATQDLTWLSFLDSGEIAKLRKTLEEERVALKQQRKANHTSAAEGPSMQPAAVPESGRKTGLGLPRKSSIKDVTGKLSNIDAGNTNHPGDQFGEEIRNKTTKLHQRSQSENSVLDKGDERRGYVADEMTSAFILPDITLHNPLKESEAAPKLSAAAQQVLDRLAQHDGQNCTVCKRVIEHGSNHRHDEAVKETVIIPKPVPVSERMPEAMPYEEEPTIRPSQPPGLALAIVMKGLQDELDHLKMQCSQYQKLYSGHDPALSKRKRKSLYKKIESLLKAIDAKADQIYALYDVLEGQKADGHEISEEEVEFTLQSIGIDAGEVGLRGGEISEKDGKAAKAARGHAWDVESADDSEEELPWEGIETTVETSKEARGAAGRRGSWTA
ncbi:PPC89 centrosome localisation domain [Lasallia pustulata]|uniref:PPC89 centrosome localisation domain n=1 Tax=Lasallia pustulata TaxID=136370 RepID=A0A1W5CSI8_9LECA|nr:PPC89 centrosome localisation domain [Lasallia pustulata]